MNDYRVTVKVRNNRILKAIESAGGAPGQKWCDGNGLNYQQVNDLINMKISPLTSAGDMREVSSRLCDVVNCLPEDLWSNEQLYPLERNLSEIEMSLEGVLDLLSESHESSYLHDFSSVEKEQQSALIDKAMAMLTSREESVLRMRFYEDMTLEQVGKVLGVTRERIRGIEAKALRKMRVKGWLKEAV